MKLPRFWIDYIHKTFSCQSSHFFQCFLVFFPELTGSGLKFLRSDSRKFSSSSLITQKWKETWSWGRRGSKGVLEASLVWYWGEDPTSSRHFIHPFFFLQNSWVVKIIWNLASVLLYGHACTIILSINTNKPSHWVPKLIEKEYVLIPDFKSWQ